MCKYIKFTFEKHDYFTLENYTYYTVLLLYDRQDAHYTLGWV